jgi:hypothetical protein
MACQGCGETRDDEVEFYLSDESPEVADEELLERARSGADRLCEFCDTANPADAEVCRQCGAALTARQREVRVARGDEEEPPPPAPAQQPAPRRKGRRLGLMGCLGLLVAGAAALLLGRLWQRDVTVTVTAVAWERSVDAEKLATETRKGWQGELPGGARPLASRRAVRETRQVQVGTRTVMRTEEVREQVGTEKVKVGTRDLGNGFFEDVFEERPVYATRTRQTPVEEPVFRDEPVYGTEITYEIDEWQVVRTATASGSDLEPRWPELAPGERERDGSRSESCRVFLRSSRGKRYTQEVGCARLARYGPGTKLEVKVDRFGKIRRLGGS